MLIQALNSGEEGTSGTHANEWMQQDITHICTNTKWKGIMYLIIHTLVIKII